MTVGSRGRTDPDGSRRRTLLVLALSTAIGSAGLAAGGTAGALLGADLAGNEAAAGLPLGLLVVGQAAAAVLVSRRTSRVGRGRSLMLCYVLGTSGAVLVVLAAAVGSLVAFLAGLYLVAIFCFAVAALLLWGASNPATSRTSGGGRYLLYLMREGDSYTTSICSGSQPVGGSLPPELAETLGKGTAPGILQAMPQTGRPDVLSLAALTGLMASGIGVVVWRWAR